MRPRPRFATRAGTDDPARACPSGGADDFDLGHDLQYLAFTREADSFGEAVLSAVNAVEKVGGVNVSTDGSVERPQFSHDRVAGAALDALMTFRLHTAGLASGIQDTLLAISQHPTQGVRHWLEHSHAAA